MNPHEILLDDLRKVLRLAENKEFHDFQNTIFATPKRELVRQLESIVLNVKIGKYDD